MPSTTNHALPYPEGTDPAVVPADLQASMEAVDTALDGIGLAQITGVPAGRLLIANGSGVVTGVSMSGDATISNTGALSIGEGKITRQMLSTVIKTARATLTAGNVLVDLTWGSQFPNTNYTVAISGELATKALRFVNKTTSGIRVTCVDGGSMPVDVEINAIAIASA